MSADSAATVAATVAAAAVAAAAAASSSTTTSASGSSYKQLKEDFVSGHSGGSVSEINYVTAVAPVALILWSGLQARQTFFKPPTPIGLAVDFLLNVCAILLATTLYASSPILLCILLVAPAVIVFGLPPHLAYRRRKPTKPPPNAQAKAAAAAASNGGDQSVMPLKAFLTNYRGGMLVITCLAILAVDFRIFPRRFAKVETWGTSLMDMGVGSFVFSGGLVAARPVLKERASGRSTALGHRLVYSMRHSLPLLALGVVRLLSVKGLDYAEHVSEYGVHWNFFFTLGFLPPFVAASQSAMRLIPSYAALAVLLAVLYQVVLESTQLKAFILTAPRTDLLSMNREGIFSFLGYLAIFLAGMDAGMYVLPRRMGPRPAGSYAQRNALLRRLAIWSAIWAALYVFTTNYTYGAGLTVSRRMANLPYVLWVTAFNTAQILGYCFVDACFFPPTAVDAESVDAKAEREVYKTATSTILHAYNRNGLAIFLLANLLTGLVNMTVPTLDVGPVPAMAILLGYAAVLTAVAVGLDAYDVSIKL